MVVNISSDSTDSVHKLEKVKFGEFDHSMMTPMIRMMQYCNYDNDVGMQDGFV